MNWILLSPPPVSSDPDTPQNLERAHMEKWSRTPMFYTTEPNELYAQNMEYRHQYDEIMKHFGEGRLKEARAILKDLQLHNINIASYYTVPKIYCHQ